MTKIKKFKKYGCGDGDVYIDIDEIACFHEDSVIYPEDCRGRTIILKNGKEIVVRNPIEDIVGMMGAR